VTDSRFVIQVVLPTPAHSRLPEVLSYRHTQALPLGTLVRVPLGARELLGLVWRGSQGALAADADAGFDLKPVAAVLDVLPLTVAWCKLMEFAASYYQRYVGELVMAALPPQLRELDAVQMNRMLAKRHKKRQKSQADVAHGAVLDAVSDAISDAAAVVLTHGSEQTQSSGRVRLSSEQAIVLTELAKPDSRPILLFGATGSGKTEVYLRRVEAVLAAHPKAQALVLVPEINLTPQLEARFQARIEAQFGVGSVVLMHSGMTPAQRLASWLSAHSGEARLVLGTRLAVLASMPHLALIIVDEEHDPSYKSQDGSRYSARDLAVYRAGADGAQVILGSATPSIETWHNAAAPETLAGSGAGSGAGNGTGTTAQVSSAISSFVRGGRYRRVDMPTRISSAAMPKVRLLDMRLQKKASLLGGSIAPALLEAIEQRIARGEQSLLFLNRRGYAPVLHCSACEWKSDCPHCSAHQVFHKLDRRLRCHHCSLVSPVPRLCPLCGNLDIGTQGRGTEQLEEAIVQALERSLGGANTARVLRIDADSAKGKDRLEAQLASVHAGDVDVLVGTQMVTKGHDFRRITLVAAINPDSALFAADFRAPERLFSLLMQAAGRAGRDVAVSAQAEMWLQTHHPMHPLFKALQNHDYPAFAQSQLTERQGAMMPPFSYQALLRCEAKTQETAQAFLDHAAALVQSEAVFEPWRDPQISGFVTLYPAVPMPMQRVANIERAQMLVESASRAALQKMLAVWQPYLRELKVASIYRWALDVDPLTI
jgi:primosomal protein N' (replication factor Y) (superfamily II helicase)